jgi:Zn-dependent peptidase ImmA (M78 family)/DNA-binding XRE family transcriptional regulator
MPADPLAAHPVELGARLREARTARGWTQEQAADALGVARTTMVAIEKGERRLKPEELIRLARLYGRKLSALLRPGAPVEDVSVQLRGALPSPGEAPTEADLLPHIHELERLRDDALELERMLGAPLPRRDPPVYGMEGIDPEQLAEDVATAERNRLGLGEAPVLNLRAVLDGDVGLRIFYLDLPSTVAGMFAFTDEHGGTLAINRNHPPERRRHSLAHEYGHYLTDRFRAEITLLGRYERRPPSERFAETFARAFLMPAAGLKRRYHELARQRSLEDRGGPTPGDLCHLAHFYFVSFEAATLRLEELGLVRAGTWQRLHQRGFRVKEARRLLGLQEHPVEDELLPSRYRYLAAEAWHRGKLSEGQLASFLRVDRLGARRLVREIGLHQEEGGDADGSTDLFLPLAAGELR